jgi:hypothetical protein
VKGYLVVHFNLLQFTSIAFCIVILNLWVEFLLLKLEVMKHRALGFLL